MTNVLLSGCFGKMCITVANVIAGKEDMQVVSGVDMCRDMTAAFPTYTNFDEVLEKPDVIIDFSDPSNLSDLLSFALKNNVPAVIATTGYTAEQIAEIKAASKQIPIFFTFNMSLGVNVLCLLAKSAAKILGDDFDIEIIEKHHNQKIDAPSGTAIMLADAVNSVFSCEKEYEYDRHVKREKRKKSEIGMHSVRGGTIVGEHDVIFAGNDEVITLSHSAQSKALFASGAVKAAAFLANQKPGMYDMQMMLDM